MGGEGVHEWVVNPGILSLIITFKKFVNNSCMFTLLISINILKFVGTSILPPSLDFLNSCSRSDTSSECRSLSPELEEYSSKDTISRNGDVREKGIKHENLLNGLSRKVGACKASSRRYVDASASVKKNLGNKEVCEFIFLLLISQLKGIRN